MSEPTIDELKAQLEAAKQEAYEAQKAAQAAADDLDSVKQYALSLAEKMKSGDTSIPISGSYKGYKFADGHRRVRNKNGELCDTEKLLAAAADKNAEGHAEAIEILDWLIKIQYGYFTKK